MREAEEVERLRLAQALRCSAFDRETAELDQCLVPAFGGADFC
jgi:hypothetical protein